MPKAECPIPGVCTIIEDPSFYIIIKPKQVLPLLAEIEEKVKLNSEGIDVCASQAGCALGSRCYERFEEFILKKRLSEKPAKKNLVPS